MSYSDHNSFAHHKKRVFLLLFFSILIIYSNTFKASWHLDDYRAIVDNPCIKIKDLSIESISGTFRSSFEGNQYKRDKIYRPIPCLTFALTYYFTGSMNVEAFHAVNILIHIITAFFLYLSVITLLKSPNLKDKYKGDEFFIALLATTFWAFNPVQIQAVTYIVQRMAAMAAMFYIIGLFCFLKARTEIKSRGQAAWFLFSLLFFLCAILSKQNAILLPAALVLIEFIFFQDISKPETKKKFLYFIISGLILIFLTGIILFIRDHNLISFLEKYENRPFTLSERLMTEPRIVIFYLTQLFYPIPTRLSIEHDIVISTSLFNPWQTLPAIFLVILLIVLGISQIKKRPVFSFAILFFFLSHSVESTILPLELLFEHRNYLPSFFLFVPMAIGLKTALNYYHQRQRSMFLIWVSFITLLIIGFGMGTYIRNMVWFSEKTLWEDVLKKSPESPRAHHNLGWAHYERTHQYDKALKLYVKALILNKYNPAVKKSVNMSNIASIYYKKKDYNKAWKIMKNAVALTPDFDLMRYGFAYVSAKVGKFETALENLDIVLSNWPDYRDALNLKGLLLLREGKPSSAIPYFKKCLEVNPDDTDALTNMGIALYYLKNYKQAEYHLKMSFQKKKEPDFLTTLWLIETNRKMGNSKDVDMYIEALFSTFPVNRLDMNMKRVYEETFDTPVPDYSMIKLVSDKLLDKSNRIKELIN